jgi:ribosomal protein L19E
VSRPFHPYKHRKLPRIGLKNEGRAKWAAAHFLTPEGAVARLTCSILRSGADRMLLSRDYVGYMAKEVVKRLVADKMIETKSVEGLTQQVRQVMAEEIGVEDRLNEEVREILSRYSEEMRRTGVSYQEMYKKVKGQLARERKLILR